MLLCDVALGRCFQIAHGKFISKEDLDEAGFHSVKVFASIYFQSYLRFIPLFILTLSVVERKDRTQVMKCKEQMMLLFLWGKRLQQVLMVFLLFFSLFVSHVLIFRRSNF